MSDDGESLNPDFGGEDVDVRSSLLNTTEVEQPADDALHNDSHSSMPNIAAQSAQAVAQSATSPVRRVTLDRRPNSPFAIGRRTESCGQMAGPPEMTYTQMDTNLQSYKAENFRLKTALDLMNKRRHYVPRMEGKTELEVLQMIETRSHRIAELEEALREKEADLATLHIASNLAETAGVVQLHEAEARIYRMEEEQKTLDLYTKELHTQHREQLHAQVNRVAELQGENDALREELGEEGVKELGDRRLSTQQHSIVVSTNQRNELELAELQEKLSAREADIVAKEARIVDLQEEAAVAKQALLDMEVVVTVDDRLEEGNVTDYVDDDEARQMTEQDGRSAEQEEPLAELEGRSTEQEARLTAEQEARLTALSAENDDLREQLAAKTSTAVHMADLMRAHADNVAEVVAHKEGIDADTSNRLLQSSASELVDRMEELITSSPAAVALLVRREDNEKSVGWATQIATDAHDGTPVDNRELRWSMRDETMQSSFGEVFKEGGDFGDDLRLSTASFLQALVDPSVVAEVDGMTDEWRERCLKLRDLVQLLYGRLLEEHKFLRRVMDKLRPSDAPDVDLSQLYLDFDVSEMECKALLDEYKDNDRCLLEAKESLHRRLSTAINTSISRLSRMSTVATTPLGESADSSEVQQIVTEGVVDNEHLAEMEKLRSAVDDKGEIVLALRAEVDDKEKSIAVLRAEIDDKENSAAALRAEVDDKGVTVAALRAEVDDKGVTVAALRAEVDELHTTLAQVTRAEEEHKTLVDQLSLLVSVEKGRSVGDAIVADLQSLRTKCETMESERTTYAEETSKTNKEWADAEERWTTEVDALTRTIDESEGEVRALRTDIDRGQTALNDAQAAMAEMEHELSAHQTEMETAGEAYKEVVNDTSTLLRYNDRLCALVRGAIDAFKGTVARTPVDEGEADLRARMDAALQKGETDIARFEFVCNALGKTNESLKRTQQLLLAAEEGEEEMKGKLATEMASRDSAVRQLEHRLSDVRKELTTALAAGEEQEAMVATQNRTVADLEARLAVAREQKASQERVDELVALIEKNNAELEGWRERHEKLAADANAKEQSLRAEIRSLEEKTAQLESRRRLSMERGETQQRAGATASASVETSGSAPVGQDDVVKECRELYREIRTALGKTGDRVKRYGDQHRVMTMNDFSNVLDDMRDIRMAWEKCRIALRLLYDGYIAAMRMTARDADRVLMASSDADKCDLHAAVITYQSSEIRRLTEKVVGLEEIASNDAQRAKSSDVYDMVRGQRKALGSALGGVKTWIGNVPGARILHHSASSSTPLQQHDEENNKEVNGKKGNLLHYALSNKN